MKRSIRPSPIAAGLVLLLAAGARAQTTAARITGSILDPSRAVIPGARITARNLDTGVERSAVSTGDGYVLYPLAPGIYSLTVEAAGFRTETIERIQLDVAANVTRNVALQVGSMDQQVVVSAEMQRELTQSISVESTIVREQIDALPLNGRDFNQLVLLAPGAVENINSGNGKDFGAVAANGNRAFSNDYLLDGTANNDVFQGRSGAAVSVDVIREFKVTSGVAPAEYGQAGTQVTLVTRSGTNQFHGSAFEYHRGNTWQARHPFNTMGQQPFRRNQFGGSFGGPVRLPRYNGRNRTFFFVNYEANRQNEKVTRVATTPLDAFWKGDFSVLLQRGIQLRDPLAEGRPIIPGNRLDQYLGGARIHTTALKMRPFWASPNQPGLANNLQQFPTEISNGDQFTVRLDHQLPRNQALSGRYTQANTGGFTPSILGNGSGLNTPVDNNNTGVTWTVPINPLTVNEFRLGYARYYAVTTYYDGGLPTSSALGLKGYGPTIDGIPPMPRISFSGGDAFTQLNYGGNQNFGMAALTKVSRIYSVSDALTRASGRHVLKAGFELRRTNLPSLQQSNASGQISFSASTTSANSTGYSFADFLIGVPSSSQEVPVKQPILLIQTELASFIQDDWRVTPKLTLTAGLRHELFLNPYEDRNRLAMFDITRGAIVVASDNGRLPVDQFLPAVVAKLTDANGNWRFPLLTDKEAGFNPRRLIDTRYNHWGPRFGFVYQIGSRMVVRGGYGIFYTRYPIQYLLQTVAVNPPFAGLFTHSQRITNGVPALTLDAPFAQSGSASVSPAGLQKDFSLPDNQQWNLAVERDLGSGTIFSLGYVGNKGTHLFRSINANASFLDSSGVVVRQYSSTFGTSTINFRQTNGNSIYNAMQVEVRRRARKGLVVQGNWTWAKGLDDTGSTVQAALLDVQNLGRDRADSDYVRRHVTKINAVYDLPFGRGHVLGAGGPRWLHYAIGGWKLSGIWQYTTGMRLTPQFSSQGGLSNSRPDVVYGAQANLPRDRRTPQRWFNPDAFVQVPAVDPVTGKPRFGNAGRNILVGPGLNVLDANLAKSFPVHGERHRITFRLEAFNVLNHSNYDFPENNISNRNTVATINDVVKPMRQVQFAIRYDF